MRVMCGHGSQTGRSDSEKDQFYNEMYEWDLQHPGDMILSVGRL